MRTDVLVTLADKNFIDQAKQLFSSAYWNGGWQGDYLLLAHEIPEEDLRWFREKGIMVFPCRALLEGTVGRHHHPATVLSKFHLLSPFFKQWKHVIFLDADIIVRASLGRLTKTDGLLAPDATGLSLKKEFSREDRALFRKLRREYPLRGKAFNTGVFSFSTDLLEDDSFERMTALFRKFGSLNVYGEEGTFNLFWYRQWEMLPIFYNAYPAFMRNAFGMEYKNLQAIIIHFVRTTKPWDPSSSFHTEWMRNLERAEAMDLAKRPNAAKTWTEDEERKYQRALFLPGLLISLTRHTRPVSDYVIHAWWWMKSARWYFIRFAARINRLIGQIGLLVKKLSPSTYEKIRTKHE